MIAVTPSISIHENEIQLDFIRSSGPGGQNVNKVASAVQLRFNITASETLPEDVKLRLRTIARNRISEDGVLVIEAKRFRTQEQNREDAITRLVALIQQSTEKPKLRKKTRPSAASKEKRIVAKKTRGAIKRIRRAPPHEFES
jgi:ribosome-associated protein